jgi:hypothetical protein
MGRFLSGLSRELPPTGGQKQWQPYFQRTFEVYTKVNTHVFLHSRQNTDDGAVALEISTAAQVRLTGFGLWEMGEWIQTRRTEVCWRTRTTMDSRDGKWARLHQRLDNSITTTSKQS